MPTYWDDYLEIIKENLPYMTFQQLLEGYHNYLLKNKQFIKGVEKTNNIGE